MGVLHKMACARAYISSAQMPRQLLSESSHLNATTAHESLQSSYNLSSSFLRHNVKIWQSRPSELPGHFQVCIARRTSGCWQGVGSKATNLEYACRPVKAREENTASSRNAFPHSKPEQNRSRARISTAALSIAETCILSEELPLIEIDNTMANSPQGNVAQKGSPKNVSDASGDSSKATSWVPKRMSEAVVHFLKQPSVLVSLATIAAVATIRSRFPWTLADAPGKLQK